MIHPLSTPASGRASPPASVRGQGSVSASQTASCTVDKTAATAVTASAGGQSTGDPERAQVDEYRARNGINDADGATLGAETDA
jgi:hypothetical protein